MVFRIHFCQDSYFNIFELLESGTERKTLLRDGWMATKGESQMKWKLKNIKKEMEKPKTATKEMCFEHTHGRHG